MTVKIAKIIATSFYYRTVRNNTVLTGNPPVFTLHSQNFKNDDEIKKLILFNIEQENLCNPGLPVDIVFVNNDVGNVDGNNFVKGLNNKKLKNGKVIAIHNNSNSGWSYGAFNKGFQELQNDYDYFIFTEDDVIITKDNYAKIGLNTFVNKENCGFVSYWGLCFSQFENLSKKDSIHAHGASGFTSSDILRKVTKKYGRLPYSDSFNKDDYNKIILEGEIKFTNVILKMGYSLTEVPNNQKLFEPAYDLMRGIYKPWKPSFLIKITWILKTKIRKFLYHLLIFLRIHKFYVRIRKFFFNI